MMLFLLIITNMMTMIDDDFFHGFDMMIHDDRYSEFMMLDNDVDHAK